MGDRRKCQTFAASPAEPGVSRLCETKALRHPSIQIIDATFSSPIRRASARTSRFWSSRS